MVVTNSSPCCLAPRFNVRNRERERDWERGERGGERQREIDRDRQRERMIEIDRGEAREETGHRKLRRRVWDSMYSEKQVDAGTHARTHTE